MAPGVSSCLYRDVPSSISFSGSGFLSTYQLGVAQCFLQYAPWILRTAPCVFGASAGSLVAAAVVCEMSPVTIREEVLNFAKQMKTFTLGPLNPSINVLKWLEYVLNKYLPSDAHQLASGRLAVAMTRLTDNKLTIMTEFQSREDVVQALLCSCFVPGYCGLLPPSFKGVHYVDGGFRSMQPVSDASCTPILTVSPFSGDVDICPSDGPSMWDMVVSGTTLKGNIANSFRIFNALYPMALETLDQAYHGGYKDAFDFLLNNNLAEQSILNKVPPNDALYFDQTKKWSNLEPNIEQEEGKKERKRTTDAVKNITDHGRVKSSSDEEEPSRKPTETGSSLCFEDVKNAVMGNMMTYLTMFGLPARILSHLLLPLIVSYYALLVSRQRLELVFRQAPEIVFWLWHAVRHFTLFFYEIFVSTVKKNLLNRIMPTILLLQWLKIHARYEAPPADKHAFPGHEVPSSAHSERTKRSPL